jgi:hypothetical protein
MKDISVNFVPYQTHNIMLCLQEAKGQIYGILWGIYPTYWYKTVVRKCQLWYYYFCQICKCKKRSNINCSVLSLFYVVDVSRVKIREPDM